MTRQCFGNWKEKEGYVAHMKKGWDVVRKDHIPSLGIMTMCHR